MNELIDGLLLYEITLLVLGVILFLILSIGLLYYIIKKEQIAKLLFFFFIPIVMIGYPSITQITISNDKIELTKLQNQVLENPEDSVAVRKMENLTEKLEKRATTPEDLVQVSTSNLLLGNNEKAAELADKALAKNNNSTEAIDIKKMATLQESFRSNLVREEAASLREETNLTTVSPNSEAAIAESPTLEATPQIRNDTALVEVSQQTKALKQMDVASDLTKVKSFLIHKSLQNSGRETDLNR